MRNNIAQKNIPQGWQEKKLGDVCDIINGSTPKRSVSEYWDNASIPWFTVDDIRNNGRIINKTNQSITDKALKETSVKLLPKDSVLLCCTASLGEVALTKIPLTTNQQFNGLVSKDKGNLYPYYLFYSAQKLGEGLKSKSGKTTINFLSVGSLSKEKVLIPPIKEQQKIAEILGTVDEDIAKTEGLIEATEKLKRGLMQQLFTHGIGHTKFKETKIGQIPEEWQLIKMKDICTVRQGLQIAISQRFTEYEVGRYKYITLKSIKENIYDYIESPKQSVICTKDDVLMTRTGNTGVVVTGMEGVFHNNFFLVDFDRSRVLKNYLVYYFLREDIKKIVLEKAGTTTIPDLNHDAFYGIDFVIPDLSEQNKITEILSAVDEKISINKKLKAKLTKLKKGLMQDLLNGRVRVNLYK